MDDKTVQIEDIGVLGAIIPGLLKNSSPRVQMSWGQAQQAVVPKGAELPINLSGFEDQLTESTFRCVAPVDMEIIEVINKFPRSAMGGSEDTNPLTTVIYLNYTKLEEEGIYEFDVLHIEGFQNQSVKTHVTFSYDMIKTDAGRRIRPGTNVREGTVLTETPTSHDGFYGTGVLLNTAYFGRHPTIEDGFYINEDRLDDLSAKSTTTYTTNWGKKAYPLTTYGDNTFPERGEKVRDDGLVCATRDYHPFLDCILMTKKNFKRVSDSFDNCIYGHAGAVVRDISVYTPTRESNASRKTPAGLEVQADEYAALTEAYYERIIDTYNRYCKGTSSERNKKATLSPELQALVSYAFGDRPNQAYRAITEKKAGRDRNTIIRTQRATPIDEWQVNITTMFDFKAENGVKLTGTAGNKGVVCRHAPPEQLGKDEYGRQLDLAVYGRGAISRLNAGQFEEQATAGYAEFVGGILKEVYELGRIAEAIAIYDLYLKAASDTEYQIWKKLPHTTRVEVIGCIAGTRLRVTSPINDKAKMVAMVENLRRSFGPLPKSAITYVNEQGEVKTTVDKVLIAPMYVWVLEKMDHKPFASNGLKRQHHGLPAKEGKSTKYSTPTKEQGPRTFGEAEHRALAASVGGLNLQHVMDISSNPEATYHLHRAHFLSSDFSSIYNPIPRDIVPYNSKASSFIKLIFFCRGTSLRQVRRTLNRTKVMDNLNK